MPDYSMCQNEQCTLHDQCARFMAEPDPYAQSYAYFKQDENGKCDAYWDMKRYPPPFKLKGRE